jgi:hypothetical protein
MTNRSRRDSALVSIVLITLAIVGALASQPSLSLYLAIAVVYTGAYWARWCLGKEPTSQCRFSIFWAGATAVVILPFLLPSKLLLLSASLLIAIAAYALASLTHPSKSASGATRIDQRQRSVRTVAALSLSLAVICVVTFVTTILLGDAEPTDFRTAIRWSNLRPETAFESYSSPDRIYARLADAILLIGVIAALNFVCRACTVIVQLIGPRDGGMTVAAAVAGKGKSDFWSWSYSTSPIALVVYGLIRLTRLLSLLQWIKAVSRHAPITVSMLTTNRSGRIDIPPWLTEAYWTFSLVALVVISIPPSHGVVSSMLEFLEHEHPSLVPIISLYFYIEAISWVLYYSFFRLYYEGSDRYTIFHRLEYLLLHPIAGGVQLVAIGLVSGGLPLRSEVRGAIEASRDTDPPTVLSPLESMAASGWALFSGTLGNDSASALGKVLLALTSVVMSIVVLAYLVNGLPQPRTKDEHGVRKGLTIVGSGDVVLNRIVPAVQRLWRIFPETGGPIHVITTALPRTDDLKQIRQSQSPTSFEVSDMPSLLANGKLSPLHNVATPLVIATPTASHLALARAATQRFQFCAVEKPMCGPSQQGEIRELLKEDAARRLFFLAYYMQEKALPLVVLLIDIASRRPIETRDDGLGRHLPAMRKAREFFTPLVDIQGEGSSPALDAVASSLGGLKRCELKLHEDASKSPTGISNRIWTEVDSRETPEHGGTLFETALHAHMIERLAKYACADSRALKAPATWNFSKNQVRETCLNDHLNAQGSAPGKIFHATAMTAHTKCEELEFYISVKKFAECQERLAKLVFENGDLEMNFDTGVMTIAFRHRGSIGSSRVTLRRAYADPSENYLTLMLLFDRFVNAGGFERDARWDLSLLQLECLEILEKRVLESLDATARY